MYGEFTVRSLIIDQIKKWGKIKQFRDDLEYDLYFACSQDQIRRTLRPRPHVYVFKSTPFSKVSVFESLHFQTRFRKSPFLVKTETFENAE